MSQIVEMLIAALSVIVGIVVHESAHAAAAYALGDDTARSRGRISLNPLNHIDPFGTIILPLLMIVAGGPVFAFAKPVPIYLNNLKHPKRDEVLVSLAGPASNIILAVVAALLLRALGGGTGLFYMLSNAGLMSLFMNFLLTSIMTNLSLAFFNLIPLPPLDGSSVIVPFLRGKALQAYYQIQHYAMPILLVILYILPTVLHLDLVSLYFQFTVYPVGDALLSLALG